MVGPPGDHAVQGLFTNRGDGATHDDDSEEDFITQHLPEVPVDGKNLCLDVLLSFPKFCNF